MKKRKRGVSFEIPFVMPKTIDGLLTFFPYEAEKYIVPFPWNLASAVGTNTAILLDHLANSVYVYLKREKTKQIIEGNLVHVRGSVNQCTKVAICKVKENTYQISFDCIMKRCRFRKEQIGKYAKRLHNNRLIQIEFSETPDILTFQLTPIYFHFMEFCSYFGKIYSIFDNLDFSNEKPSQIIKEYYKEKKRMFPNGPLPFETWITGTEDILFAPFLK